jgi:hypothetical protein
MRRGFLFHGIAMLIAALPAAAQETTGALAGMVRGPGGVPLVGARVALESPALFAPKVVRTDARGQYRAQLLPVGNYVIRVSADGYLGRTVQGVRVGVGTNNALDFDLTALREQGTTVEVVDTLVKESKASDTVATNFSGETLTLLPSDKSWESVAALSPGVTGGGGAPLNIRGGSTFGQGHNAAGGGYSQVNYTIDGIDVKNDTGSQGDSAFGSTIFDALPDSIEDMQVVQSQLNARYGRTNGGAINVVTKSGSNTFEGTVRCFVDRPSWTTNLPKGSVAGIVQAEMSANEHYSRYTDITFSGPILKDRLWFFLGTRLQPSVAGSVRVGWGSPAVMQRYDNGAWTDLPGAWEQYMKYPLTTFGLYPRVDAALRGGVGLDGQAVPGISAYPTGFSGPDLRQTDNGAILPADTSFYRYQGKLTGQVNTDNTVALTFLYAKTVAGGYTGERTSPPYTTVNLGFVGEAVTRINAFTLNWNSTLGEHWFLEAKVAHSQDTTADVPGITRYPVDVQSTISTGDPAIQLYSGEDGQAQSWGGHSAYFGNFYTLRSSSSITPNYVANNTATFNLKTFQEALGQHEIDLGAEFYQTEHQFGRERNRNYSVMEGGWIRDPSKSVYDADGYLFPVYYTSDGSPMTPLGPDGLPDGALSLYQQDLYGPSSNIEQYTVGVSRSHNNSTALWLNDTWTPSDHWNIMAGLRFNRFLVHDTSGRTQCDNRIFEPRLQVKFDPVGKGEEYYTFTAAKLASRYSDDFASYFRSNGWTSRVVRGWNGANLSSYQEPIDSAAAAADPLAGVRWVNYDQLIDLGNYNTVPSLVVALDQTMVTRGLQVPYALEFTLGFTRNWSDGSLKVSLVERDYRKDWVAFVHNGIYDPTNPVAYLTLVKNPVTGQPYSWNQTQNFINSDLHRDYQDLEISWNQRLGQHLSFAGNFTYAVEHGALGTDGLNYYNYRDEKLRLGLDPALYAPTDALLSRTHMLNLLLTYQVPVGKGNLSASLLGKLYNQGQRSLAGTSNLNLSNPETSYQGLPIVAVDGNVGQNLNQVLERYDGTPNGFSAGNEVFNTSMKLQARLPITGRVSFVTEITISNVFNRINRNSIYDWGSGGEVGTDGVSDLPIPGRPLGQFNHPWGYAGNSAYYDQGRTWSFNAGITF